MEIVEPSYWAAVAAITLLSGFVKGVVGFAMPLIIVSATATFLPVPIAIAALVMPTLASNFMQVMRDGLGPALASARRFRVFIAVVVVAIPLSAQLVRVLPTEAMLGLLGAVVLIFAATQLVGLRLRVRPGTETRTELVLGLAAGLIGGVSGSWSPPTVMLLTALDVPKREHVRMQGAVYFLGSVALVLGHIQSGVLTPATTLFSAAMVVPALGGMWLGFRIHDRLDPVRFRRAVLAVLIIVGLNLVRRALF